MKKPDDRKPELARLPNDEKVRIESVEGDSALAIRIEGPRKGTLAICSIDKLKPIEPRDSQSRRYCSFSRPLLLLDSSFLNLWRR
jgi:hypothetical protein